MENIFFKLCINDKERHRAADELQEQVRTAARLMTTQELSQFYPALDQRVFELVCTKDKNYQIGGLLAIQRLIEVNNGTMNVTRFAGCLSSAWKKSHEDAVLYAAQALGKLLTSGDDAYTKEFLEQELNEVERQIRTMGESRVGALNLCLEIHNLIPQWRKQQLQECILPCFWELSKQQTSLALDAFLCMLDSNMENLEIAVETAIKLKRVDVIAKLGPKSKNPFICQFLQKQKNESKFDVADALGNLSHEPFVKSFFPFLIHVAELNQETGFKALKKVILLNKPTLEQQIQIQKIVSKLEFPCDDAYECLCCLDVKIDLFSKKITNGWIKAIKCLFKQEWEPKLLDYISVLLFKRTYFCNSSVNNFATNTEIILALKTIGLFEFKEDLLSFSCRIASIYFYHDDADVRERAASCIVKVLRPSKSMYSKIEVNYVVDRLMELSVTDVEWVRIQILIMLSSIIPFLIRQKSIKCLFLTANEQNLSLKTKALNLLLLLAPLNPMAVYPNIRKMLKRHLLDKPSQFPREQEHYFLVLESLLKFKKIVYPLVPLVLSALKIDSLPAISIASMKCVSQLPFVPKEITNQLICSVLNQATRQQALLTLEKVEQNLNLELVQVLFLVMDSEPLAIKLFAKLGAIDPLFQHQKTNLQNEPWDFFSNQELYPSCALKLLCEVVFDSSLIVHHPLALKCIFLIFKNGVKSQNFLHHILPKLLESSLTERLFTELGSLVQVLWMYLDKYILQFISLIQKNLKQHPLAALCFLESFLYLDVKCVKNELLDIFKTMLQTDYQIKTLEILSSLHHKLEDHFFALLPTLVDLLQSMDILLQKQTLATLTQVCTNSNICLHLSTIIHPILNCLKSPELVSNAMDCLCCLLCRNEILIFVPQIQKTLCLLQIRHVVFEQKLSQVLNNIEQPLPKPNIKKRTIPKQKTLTVNKARIRMVFLKVPIEKELNEWFQTLCIELVKESSSQSIRYCAQLALVYSKLARNMFNAAFLSCWVDLSDDLKKVVLNTILFILNSDNLELKMVFLNLCEFMAKHEHPIPINLSTLATCATNCRAFAKALYYRELEFKQNSNIDELIYLNSNLQLHDAAVGILKMAKLNLVNLNREWFHLLNKWDEELQIDDFENLLKTLQCLSHLGEAEKISQICEQKWLDLNQEQRNLVSVYAAQSEWDLFKFEKMNLYIEYIPKETADYFFFKAVFSIKTKKQSIDFIENCRTILNREFTTLCKESYHRAYDVAVRIQGLVELEEVIQYPTLTTEMQQKQKLIWNTRLLRMQKQVESWSFILRVRSLVLGFKDQAEMWIKFSSICRKQNRPKLAERVLNSLIDNRNILNCSCMESYAYLKHLFYQKSKEALELMPQICQSIKSKKFKARCYYTFAKYQKESDIINEETFDCLKKAVELDKDWCKAWRAYANLNSKFCSIENVLICLKALSQCIRLSNDVQDVLRFLTVWFKYGANMEVDQLINFELETISLEKWLNVIPQIIARINSNIDFVQKTTHQLLIKISKHHPQALIYPLLVASNQPTSSAHDILQQMKLNFPNLVQQGQLVSRELIRAAITWHEAWHEGLEEASRCCFEQNNISGMFQILDPLYDMLLKVETLHEQSFLSFVGVELHAARDHLEEYKKSSKESDLKAAWDVFYLVFKRLTKYLNQWKTIELQMVAPKLEINGLELAVPGTYPSTEVYINRFQKTFHMIPSKQRPRKLCIYGSDGKEYHFLLKGHEDLRQDERVMQLFSLVNKLLEKNQETLKRHLYIKNYSVIPLSKNSGLIEWVPDCDTFHSLISEYREQKGIDINLEHKLILDKAPNFDYLSLEKKVEAFDYAMSLTSGMDLNQVLFLKSRNLEEWLEKRQTYTRSLAVMSMVGYVLGLGDRHPSNLMLHRHTGQVVHIDFGDCFEVAMVREKFPEKIPFRLTRMLINAMEISGVEGSFFIVCELVMNVLRQNHEHVMALLEAFVYDPLINWRLAKSESDLEDRVLQVINRVSNKLSGKDFGNEVLDVKTQVLKLISQATSTENLCHCYVGWCAFW